MKRKSTNTTEITGNKPIPTVNQVAAILQFHPESVRRAIRAGRIKAIKVGQEWRIPHEVAESILREGLPSAAA